MIGTLFAKRYLIQAPLGKGGFGEVWLADDVNRGKPVALKIFPAGSPTFHAYHEARVLTLIANDYVLRVSNADTFIDVPYIATEVAAAGTTEDRAAVPPGLGLPAPLVVRWLRHALVGLDACHDMDLVHRDVKASNIFLNADDWALLGDFGIAHRVDAQGRVPVQGTPVTTPPEALTAGFLTKLSDIYAIGVTGYRLLVGVWPFTGVSIPDVYQAILNRAYVPLRDAAPQVPGRLAKRIERAMSADPARRQQSPMELHDELGAHDLVRRVWQRQAPHPGHQACWLEIDPVGAGHEVCLVPRGKVFDIDAHFVSGRRILAHSLAGVRPDDVPRRLRRVFDRL